MNKVLIQRNKTENLDNTYIAPVDNHWEPNIGEVYFYVVYPSREIQSAEFTSDENFKIHQTRIINGNCFKSYDSAVAKLEAEDHNKEVDKKKEKNSFNIRNNIDMIQNMFIGIAEDEYKRGYEDGYQEGYNNDQRFEKYKDITENLKFVQSEAEQLQELINETILTNNHFPDSLDQKKLSKILNDMYALAVNTKLNTSSALIKIERDKL